VKQLTSKIIILFWILIGSYGLGVTLYTLLQYTIGERFIAVAWLNNGAHLLWAGAIVLLVPSIIFRKQGIIALMILPTLAFTVNYLPMYLPREVDPPLNTQQLRVLTYNINLAPPDITNIANDIRKIDADIVAIQELTFDTIDMLEVMLSDLYPYRALHPVKGFHGQGILSKYPIVNDEFWNIYLGHQRAEIDINGEVITVYNLHPVHHLAGGFNVSLRTEEIDFALNKAKHDQTPILLMGDFNMTDQSADYQGITSTYQDSYKQVGFGMGTTFPAHIPFLPSLARIDYIFHSKEFTALDAHVLRSTGGSDHRPLVVTLALDRTG
jgi:vancomycin resistance protein VanJ